jgi:hypothetical protein
LNSHLIERTIEITMARLNHISVEINATFGSTFQEETALRMLNKYIYGWKAFFLEKHSKNAIEFRITNAEEITTQRRPRPRKRQPALP